GNVSVVGATNSTNFPTTNTFYPYGGPNGPGTFGNFDVFVAHFDPTFGFTQYSSYIGGISDDFGSGLAAAQLPGSTTNYTFVGGYSSSPDFPKTTTSTNNQTGFVTLISETNISKLGFVGSPGNAPVGSTIPSVKVAVQDANGVTVTDANNAVTIQISANPCGTGTLSGTLTVNAVNGIATFNDLSIDVACNGYTLVASSTSPALISQPSNPFNIFQPVLVFTAQPTNTLTGSTM